MAEFTFGKGTTSSSSSSMPRSSSIVLIVTEAFAISTSTSKISPSLLCNLMFGISRLLETDRSRQPERKLAHGLRKLPLSIIRPISSLQQQRRLINPGSCLPELGLFSTKSSYRESVVENVLHEFQWVFHCENGYLSLVLPVICGDRTEGNSDTEDENRIQTHNHCNGNVFVLWKSGYHLRFPMQATTIIVLLERPGDPSAVGKGNDVRRRGKFKYFFDIYIQIYIYIDMFHWESSA